MGGLIQGGMCLILWPRGHVFDVIAKGVDTYLEGGGGVLFRE